MPQDGEEEEGAQLAVFAMLIPRAPFCQDPTTFRLIVFFAVYRVRDVLILPEWLLSDNDFDLILPRYSSWC